MICLRSHHWEIAFEPGLEALPAQRWHLCSGVIRVTIHPDLPQTVPVLACKPCILGNSSILGKLGQQIAHQEEVGMCAHPSSVADPLGLKPCPSTSLTLRMWVANTCPLISGPPTPVLHPPGFLAHCHRIWGFLAHSPSPGGTQLGYSCGG